jgi:hypothetical protein
MDDLAGSNVQVWLVIMLVPLMRWVAALVAALRGELAGSRAALARAQEDLARARERIAELEARLRLGPRGFV